MDVPSERGSYMKVGDVVRVGVKGIDQEVFFSFVVLLGFESGLEKFWFVTNTGLIESQTKEQILAFRQKGLHEHVTLQLSQLGTTTIEAGAFFVKYFPHTTLRCEGGTLVFETWYDTREP